jgi:predicted Rossmann-fold nucleotide-binding protein
MKRICVYCGSSPGLLPGYAEAARQCGQTLAARGLGLVYGGGNVGLMKMAGSTEKGISHAPKLGIF